MGQFIDTLDTGIVLKDTGRVKKIVVLGPGDLVASGTTLVLIGGISVIRGFGAGQDDAVYYSLEMPRDMDTTADVNVVLCWSASNTNTGNVKWDVNLLQTEPNAGELIGISPTTFTATQAGSGTINELVGIKIDVSAFGLIPERQIDFEFQRNGTDASDTFTGTAQLSMITIEYTANKIGGVL